MIANLWPEEAHLEECVSTLRFASRVRCLQTDAQVNESGDPQLALKKAERVIRELRQELAMRDMLSGRGRVVYEDLSDGERLELQALALRFLSGAAAVVQYCKGQGVCGRVGGSHPVRQDVLQGPGSSSSCCRRPGPSLVFAARLPTASPKPLKRLLTGPPPCGLCVRVLHAGSAELDELPTDSLKRIRETYKALKAVSSSWAEAAAQGDPARTSQHSATGAVSSTCQPRLALHCSVWSACMAGQRGTGAPAPALSHGSLKQHYASERVRWLQPALS